MIISKIMTWSTNMQNFQLPFRCSDRQRCAQRQRIVCMTTISIAIHACPNGLEHFKTDVEHQHQPQAKRESFG